MASINIAISDDIISLRDWFRLEPGLILAFCPSSSRAGMNVLVNIYGKIAGAEHHYQ
jgi:hypothetical protein